MRGSALSVLARAALVRRHATSACGAAASAAAATPAPDDPPRRVPPPPGLTPAPGAPPVAIVFLGAPGVGKGTYSTRVAAALGADHVSAGDLVRAEIKAGTELGKQVAATVSRGDLLPDAVVLDLVRARLASSAAAGVPAVVDGFPRTALQAATLLATTDVRLALNLTLPESALIDKCLGRRVCGKCGRGFNVADIYVPARGAAPAIQMPPMPPPRECEPHMEVRADDNPAVVRRRLDVHAREAAPVEAAFRAAGVLIDFPVAGGVKETLPRLMEAVVGATGAENRGEAA